VGSVVQGTISFPSPRLQLFSLLQADLTTISALPNQSDVPASLCLVVEFVLPVFGLFSVYLQSVSDI